MNMDEQQASSITALIRAVRPDFKSKSDRLAFFLHAAFLVHGYRLTATGPYAESLIDKPENSQDETEVGLEGWNSLDNLYSFRYIFSGGSHKVAVKCFTIGDTFMIDAAKILPKKPIVVLHSEFNVSSHAKESEEKDFINANYKNTHTLASVVEREIFRALSKPDKEPETDVKTTMHPGPPQYPFPHNPRDQPRLPYGIGSSDLNPLGGGFNNPNDGPRLPRGPPFPTPADRVAGRGGGMLLGPDDPYWGDFGGAPWRHPYLYPGPTPNVPPGARYDPIGPPGIRGFEPERFMRDGRGGGHRGNHPDLELFRND